MLTALRLENIALAESLELSFAEGFSVFTGETGAGKSLLLDALDALTGGAQGAQGARLLRAGSSRGRIEASFTLTPPVAAWLEAQELDVDDDELLLSRDWRLQEGRLSSRHRLNGIALGRAQVQDLRPLLIDLTVQGQTQQLARPGQQRRWLDRCAGDEGLAVLDGARRAFRRWRQAAAALQQAREQEQERQRDRERQEQLLQDLEAADLQDPHERERLQGEQDRAAHGVRLQEGLAVLNGRLVEGADGVPSALDHLAACGHELQQMAQLDGGLAPSLEELLEAQAGLESLVRSLERYGAALESDPASLAAVQERLAGLRALERRHGLTLAGLIELRDRMRLELEPGGTAASLGRLQQAEAEARAERDRCQGLLSDQRRRSAATLEQQLMEALRPMGLANVRFAVAVEPSDPGEDGADAVAFLFSANPGQPLAPLAEVASGGEMSRFLLALKTCLAAADPHVTLLFDEIDSGVSGRVSGTMARLLRRLAASRQVFCVTHQPLVAAAADHHFRVSKSVDDGVTRSQVSALRDTRSREAELAELAGGDSGEAREFAASLLGRRVA